MRELTTEAGPTRPSEHEEHDRSLFDAVAEKCCSKDLSPVSSVARAQRLRQTLSYVRLPPNAAVLELGCGAGFSARYLTGRYGEFWGVDYSKKMIGIARRMNCGKGVRFECANIKSFAPPRRFDVIFAIGVLHHLDDMEAAFGHMIELLEPGGWIAANEPQPANPLIRAARWVRKRLDRAYSDDQIQLSRRQLERLFANAGLTEVQVRAQGLFSTPFAEVVLRPERLFRPAARLACAVDSFLEWSVGSWLRFASWNLVAFGRKPPSASVHQAKSA